MRVWGGQGYPNKHHEHFKVIFSITREEIELPVKIGDKNLNLTRPKPQVITIVSMSHSMRTGNEAYLAELAKRKKAA